VLNKSEREEEWLRLAKKHLSERSPLVFVLFAKDDDGLFLPLQGDFTRFGLRRGETLPLHELRGRIDNAHLFAEVLGERDYLDFLARKVFAIEDTEIFLVPWKRSSSPLWLLVRLKHTFRKDEEDVIVGEIVHIHDHEPHTLDLFRMAHQDDPTGLWNRQALRKRLPRLDPKKTHHALYIDLDDFREINNRHGHIAGDAVLQEVAERLKEGQTGKEEFYRVGGDEFLALLLDTSEAEARHFAERLLTRLQSIRLGAEEIDLSASIGLVEVTKRDRDFVRLVDKADKAMYAAKARGKATVAVDD